MIPPWAIIRGAAKLALWAFAALIAFVALWFAGNRWLDESPDPHRHAFLVSAADQLPDSSNIAVGILGLTAPANQDFVQYGAKVKSLYKANAPWADLQRMLDGPNTLKTSAELQPINCWLDPDGPPMKGCPSFEQAPAFLAEHRELLERFKQLRQMKAYSSVGIGSNRAYLFATKLAVIEIQIDLRNGHVALAYRKWRGRALPPCLLPLRGLHVPHAPHALRSFLPPVCAPHEFLGFHRHARHVRRARLRHGYRVTFPSFLRNRPQQAAVRPPQFRLFAISACFLLSDNLQR